jgi:solute carrier family 8 (sodium/calcium exchanger)
MLGPSIDEDSLILEDVSLSEALSHFVSIGWKVIFATVPPASFYGGYPCFVVSLTAIGLVVILINDFATALGCVLSIPESITGVTLVALGTSLPDTLASMTAARESDSADSAIGNVTGSNSVNVFLGLGLPWCFAATYLRAKYGDDYDYRVPSG